MIAQRISTVSGVAQVQVYGAQKFAVRVQLDPRALASRGIGIDEASAAVAAANVNIPTGTLWGQTTWSTNRSPTPPLQPPHRGSERSFARPLGHRRAPTRRERRTRCSTSN
jgi:multidrug efflux pump subunit AcrB